MLKIMSKNNEINKSKMIRYLLFYFNQTPYKLRNILEEVNELFKRIHEEWKQQIQ